MPPDLPRHDATISDRANDFTVSIDDAVARYAHAGHPRTPRSIQRYCSNGHLDCRRMETPFGEKFMITPASIDKHIAYIEEVRPGATGPDMSRNVATSVAPAVIPFSGQANAATSVDTSRQVATAAEHLASTDTATSRDMSRQDAALSQPVEREPAASPVQSKLLDRMIERLEGENDFLRLQIVAKDDQIKDLTERARETNVLIGGLQKMLTPLLGTWGGAKSDNAPNIFQKDWRNEA